MSTATARQPFSCSKRLLDGYWDNEGEIHLHELRLGQTFKLGGRRGKLLVRGVGTCTIAFKKQTTAPGRRFGTRRKATIWGRPKTVAPCTEVEIN